MKHRLPSGTEFSVTPLDWEDAWGICQDALRVIESLNIDLKGMSLQEISTQDVLNFAGPVCKILSAPEVLAACKKCFTKCTYGGVKIDGMTFNTPEGRGDFLHACFYALKENCAPFFASLLSALKAG